MYESFDNLLEVEAGDGILRLTKMNRRSGFGISRALYKALKETILVAARDKDLRAVVIETENGALHNGAVLISQFKPRLADMTGSDFEELIAMGHELGALIAALPCAVIGIAPSGALGGGLELLLRSDFLYCTDDARFSFPEVSLGLVAAWGGTQIAARTVTFRKAQEFLLLGEEIGGRAAERIGLVTRSFADEAALASHVDRVLERLRETSPVALEATKRCLAAAWAGPIGAGYAAERDQAVACMEKGDFIDRVAAFGSRGSGGPSQ